MMQILDLLGMHFDAAIVFVTNSSLLFRFALAILCTLSDNFYDNFQIDASSTYYINSIYLILRLI